MDRSDLSKPTGWIGGQALIVCPEGAGMIINAHMNRRLFVAGLTILAPPAQARMPADTQLRKLIAGNSAARGGKARLQRLRSMDATLRITEPGFTVIGRYRAERSGRMRIDVFAGGARVFSEGIDDQGAWAWPGKEAAPKPIGDAGRHALERGIVFNLVPLFDISRLGHRLSLVSADPPCIQIDFADDFATRLFLDPVSGHIVRRQDRRAYHPDQDSTEKRIEVRASDFREQDGVVSPWLSEDYDMDAGERIGRAETLRLAWDEPIGGHLPRAAQVLAPEVA